MFQYSEFYELTREHRLPFIQLGDRQYRYSESALLAWLDRGGSDIRRDDDLSEV
jgi:excisionase family DNA binding protein